jgi:DNA-binding CsgD family transcriptional regulator
LILGKTIDQIALERKTSIETVRSQLKATMAKTGTSRQVDLVKLLSMTQWPPGLPREPK